MINDGMNVVTRFYGEVIREGEKSSQVIFKYPFNTMRVSFDSNGIPFMGKFVCVTHINIYGTSRQNENNNSVFDKNSVLEFSVRISHKSNDGSVVNAWEIERFSITPYEGTKDIDDVPYYNLSRVTYVPKIELDSKIYSGKYLVKVLLREKNEGEKISPWSLQSVSDLTITD